MNLNNLTEILCCPHCHQDLLYREGRLCCFSCGKDVKVDGRLLDFNDLTPDLPLQFAKYTKKLHEQAGQTMPDIPFDWRVQSVLDLVHKLGPGNICLEIGGADGPMTPKLESLYSTVLTLDFGKSFLKRIEAKTYKAVCLYGDAHFLPIKNQSVKLVICSEVLEHVSVPTQLLLEIRRVLQEDGKCIISVPNEATNNLLDSWRNRKQLLGQDSHVTFYNSNTLRKLLFRMGLKVIDYRILNKSFRPTLSLHNLISYIFKNSGYSYILCTTEVMDDPTIYWKSLEKAIGIT